MGFQVGWLLVGQQRCDIFDCSGIDESCAQPSPKLGEHMENQKIKTQQVLPMPLTDRTRDTQMCRTSTYMKRG